METHEVEHLAASVVDMLAVTYRHLVGLHAVGMEQVGGDVREVGAAVVVAALKHLSYHIQRIAVVTRLQCLAPNLVDCKAAGFENLLDAGVALACEPRGNVGRREYAESVRLAVRAAWTCVAAELLYDFQHRGLAGAYVSPKPKPLFGIKIAGHHHTPVEDVEDGGAHAVLDGESGADRVGHLEEVVFERVSPR